MTTSEKKCPQCGSTRIRVVGGDQSETNTCRACDFVWTTPKTNAPPVRKEADQLTS